MDSNDIIKRLKESGDFIAFQKYITDEIEKINSVRDLSKLSNERAGEEAKVRALTVAKIQEIFSPFVNFREVKEITAEQIQKKKKSWGL